MPLRCLSLFPVLLCGLLLLMAIGFLPVSACCAPAAPGPALTAPVAECCLESPCHAPIELPSASCPECLGHATRLQRLAAGAEQRPAPRLQNVSREPFPVTGRTAGSGTVRACPPGPRESFADPRLLTLRSVVLLR